jgi:hypothetical protein
MICDRLAEPDATGDKSHTASEWCCARK